MRLISTLSEPAIRQAIYAMNLSKGSAGLDAGCGIGLQSFWLQEAIAPGGKVVGVDLSPENLGVAKAALDKKKLSDWISFHEGDILHLPYDENSFDWAWCADLLCPVADFDPLAGIKELQRVVKPGGQIGILFWTNQILLPGYPQLEARLNVAHINKNPYLCDIKPQKHFLYANAWLQSAGLKNVTIHSFIAQAQAPFSLEQRNALECCYAMFWGDLKPGLTHKDWSDYQRLCDLNSSDCILNNPDYHYIIIYTLFKAEKPE